MQRTHNQIIQANMRWTVWTQHCSRRPRWPAYPETKDHLKIIGEYGINFNSIVFGNQAIIWSMYLTSLDIDAMMTISFISERFINLREISLCERVSEHKTQETRSRKVQSLFWTWDQSGAGVMPPSNPPHNASILLVGDWKKPSCELQVVHYVMWVCIQPIVAPCRVQCPSGNP